MDILKNIYLNFNSVFNNFDIKLLILSLFLKIFLMLLLNNKFKIIFCYFNKFIKKNLNKKNKNFFLFFSILLFFIILLYNLIDLIPLNLIKKIFFFKNLDIVPTSNINITFCFSIICFNLINLISIKKIGIFNFCKKFLLHPIENIYMIFFNFIIEFISFIMKPISLSLRLYGNIFASDIIFNLISNMNFFLNSFLNLIWGFFHYLILPLQSFIFITLVNIYVSQLLK